MPRRPAMRVKRAEDDVVDDAGSHGCNDAPTGTGPSSTRRLLQLLLLALRRAPLQIRRTSFRSAVGIASVTFACTLLLLLQLRANILEHQGPLDHATTSAMRPFQGMRCPDFSSAADPSRRRANSTALAWDCGDVVAGGEAVSSFPKVFMIGARDADEDTFDSWSRLLLRPRGGIRGGNENGTDPAGGEEVPHLERINTLRMSNRYALSGGAVRRSEDPEGGEHEGRPLCRKMKWEQRLFAVYQTVFSRLLAAYPDDRGFVVIEDDALLEDPSAFREEVCGAARDGLEFYSLYRSPLQLRGTKAKNAFSCVYLHGTVAFYIRRGMMERIARERRPREFCRFPIDMYISRMGPWFATRREVVGHVDSGRIGSTG